LARAKAGSSREARMAMIAMTTNSSIKVKARRRPRFVPAEFIGAAEGKPLKKSHLFCFIHSRYL
jgi:hypothetical protein